MTTLNAMSLVCHLSVRWTGTLSQYVFFSLDILFFFFARPHRFGVKKVTRNIEKKAHGLRQKKNRFLHNFPIDARQTDSNAFEVILVTIEKKIGRSPVGALLWITGKLYTLPLSVS